MKHFAILAAGGTGGHINTAIALGEKLESNGFEVLYLTGRRHLDYKLYQGRNVEHLNAFPLVVGSPFKLFRNILLNMVLFIKVWLLIRKRKPEFIFGAGGYVCGPVLAAGHYQKIPIYILEQNSVFGLTNKILSKIADKIFLSFDQTVGLDKAQKSKSIVTGNPIRESFYEANFTKTDDIFTILVFGGSLGAKEINELIIDFIAIDSEIPLRIIHQIGKNFESSDHTVSENINYIQFEYLDDIITNYKDANLIICRSGASTISELKIVNKPAILIPLLIHKDKHQLHNANSLKNEKSNIWVMSTKELREYSFRETRNIIKIALEQTRVSDKTKQKNPLETVYQEIVAHVHNKS